MFLVLQTWFQFLVYWKHCANRFQKYQSSGFSDGLDAEAILLHHKNIIAFKTTSPGGCQFVKKLFRIITGLLDFCAAFTASESVVSLPIFHHPVLFINPLYCSMIGF
jgi:hypothetical protein